ncbi:SDR family oxidoreductase [Gordonia sinesedis]
MTVRGRTIAVTGGARGIGRATAEAFHHRGARVVIGDLDADLAAATATEIDPTGDYVTGVGLDVTDSESFRRFVGIADTAGGLDVLINNAGIMPTGLFADEASTMTDRLLAVNLRAVIDGSRLAVGLFVPRGSGHVINVASLAGAFAIPALATYGATKSAVTTFTDALALELRGTGVRATAVLPGLINTELSAGANYPRWVGRLVAGEPEDVANAMVRVVDSGRSGVVSVPRRAGSVIAAIGTLPRPIRLAVEDRAGLSTAFAHADPVLRERYHRRMAGS